MKFINAIKLKDKISFVINKYRKVTNTETKILIPDLYLNDSMKQF